MTGTFAKALLLATSWLLALPPGWCCSVPQMLRSLANAEADASQAPKCHCSTEVQTPDCPDHSAKETPRPITPETCCCGHRDLAPPAGVDHAIDQDFGIVITLPLARVSAHAVLPFNAAPSYLSVPFTPVHVRDCVWLC